ncbi:hypothetical protein [Bradyrhizobium sp. USDA 3256]
MPGRDRGKFSHNARMNASRWPDATGRRRACTLPAQIDALNRHRSHGEPAITVQNVKVKDGGNAIIGNVTQHASVIASDNNPASAARNAAKASRARRRQNSADAGRDAQA